MLDANGSGGPWSLLTAATPFSLLSSLPSRTLGLLILPPWPAPRSLQRFSRIPKYVPSPPALLHTLTSGDLSHSPGIPGAGSFPGPECPVDIHRDLEAFLTQTRLMVSPNTSVLPCSYSGEWKLQIVGQKSVSLPTTSTAC